MPDQVPDEVKRERIERLVELVQRIARERNRDRVGLIEEVLVEGPSRTDDAPPARAHAPEHDRATSAGERAPGELVAVEIDERDLDDAGRPAGRARRG